MKTRGQKTKVILLRVTPEMYKAIYAEAERKNRSMPELIRRATEKILPKK